MQPLPRNSEYRYPPGDKLVFEGYLPNDPSYYCVTQFNGKLRVYHFNEDYRFWRKVNGSIRRAKVLGHIASVKLGIV